MTTVRQAAELLAARCDGANALDGQGFNKFDSVFVKDVLLKAKWSAKQELAIQKTLTKYKGQLSAAGIEHSTLERETRDGIVPVNFDRKPTATLSADGGGHLLLKSPFSFRDFAKSIPTGRWKADLKVWSYQPYREVYAGLKPRLESGEVIPDETAKPVLAKLEEAWKQWQVELAAHDQNVVKAAAIKQAEDIDVDVPLKTTPMLHQKKAFAIGTTLDAAAFLMEQGTGKTLAAIAVAGYRHKHNDVSRLIIVAPLSVVPVWEAEFKKHADFPYSLVTSQTKDIKKAGSIASMFDASTPWGINVLVMNYESVWRIADQLKAWKPEMVILDESQKVKNGQTKQSKAVHGLGIRCKYKLILSGTPVTQSPLDVHSQYKFLNPEVFGKSFSEFRSRYAIRGGYQGYEVVGYRDLAELSAKAHSIAYRVTKAEALDLPPMTDQVLYCELGGTAERVYREMDKHMVATVKGKKVTTPIILTQLLRLQQIAGGFLPVTGTDDEEPTRVEQVGGEKLAILRSLIEDLPKGKKLVIFARFIPEIKAIERMLTQMELSARTLTGETEAKQRGKLVSHFQSEGSGGQILIIQIQTGGLGITLTAADTAIFYSTSFSYADYEQARARIHRIGQTKPVTYIHLLAKGTIDETVMLALKEKKNVADLVVDNLNPVKGDKMPQDDEVKKTVENLDKELSAKQKSNQPEESQAMGPKMKAAKEKTKAKLAAKAVAKPKVKVKKEVDENTVELSAIAKECKVDPIELRKALRGSKIKKPGGSWRWPQGHADIKEVKKLAESLGK